MNRFRQWMMGRYGTDQLTFALLALYIVLYFIAQLTRLPVLAWISLIPFIFCIYRMFSRNTSRRYQENVAFLRLWSPVAGWFRRLRAVAMDRRTSRYFKCPHCSGKLRVPKGKGKIRITCPVCGTEFIKKT